MLAPLRDYGMYSGALLSFHRRSSLEVWGQGEGIRICRALVGSVDPMKRACMEAKVEVHLLSAFVGESKDKPLQWGMCWTLCHSRAEAGQVSHILFFSASSQATVWGDAGKSYVPSGTNIVAVTGGTRWLMALTLSSVCRKSPT